MIATLDPYLTGQCRLSTECTNSPGDEVEFDAVSSPPIDPDELIANSGSTFGSEERDNVIPGVIIGAQHVKEHTHRVVMFLNSLIIDEDEQGPRLRIVEILKQSFAVLKRHCNNRYVPPIFGEQVLKAFLFLVREGDLASLKDVSEGDYDNIMNVLRNCADEDPAPAIKFYGRECQTRGIVSLDFMISINHHFLLLY